MAAKYVSKFQTYNSSNEINDIIDNNVDNMGTNSDSFMDQFLNERPHCKYNKKEGGIYNLFKTDSKCKLESDEDKIAFFDKLEIKMRRDDLKCRMALFESQSVPKSGLFLDFDVELRNKSVPIKGPELEDLSKCICEYIFNLFNIDDDQITIFILQREKSDGFHFKLPYIWMTKNEKKFLIHKIKTSGKLEEIIKEDKIAEGAYDKLLDKMSASVPVSLYGCSRYQKDTKIWKPPYKIMDVLTVRRDMSRESLYKFYNLHTNPNVMLSYELSLTVRIDNYDGKEKVDISLKSEYKSELTKIINKNDKYAELKNNVEDEFNRYDIKYIKELVDALTQDYCEEYGKWLKVINILVNMQRSKSVNADFRGLAQSFSIKTTKGNYSDSDFDRYWDEGMSNGKSFSYEVALGALTQLVKKCNPERLLKIRSNSLYNILIKKLIGDRIVDGKINHKIVADIIYNENRGKFFFVTDENCWYEFVTPNSKYNDGQLYKWRHIPLKVPATLKRYITNELYYALTNIILYIKNNESNDNVEDADHQENKRKYMIRILKNLQYSIQSCVGANNFAKSCIEMSADSFEKYSFADELDKNTSLFGVGNGILKLCKRNCSVELIEGFHEHYISKFTKVNYVEFDPYDEDTVYLIKTFRNMFQDSKMDKFYWTMMSLASALDGDLKYQALNILKSPGESGKSILANMWRMVLGQYGTTMNSNYLTNDKEDGDGPTPQKAMMNKTRGIYFSEIDIKKNLSIKKLKETFSGGETSTYRNLHEGMKEMKIAATFFLLANNNLSIQTKDESVWKRIKLITLEKQFYDKDHPYYDPTNPNHMLPDPRVKTLADDANMKSKFLSILVFFWRLLQYKYNGDMGKIPHPNIKLDTDNYRNEEDHINRFLTMNMINSPGYTSEISDIVKIYKEWYKHSNGADIDSSKINLKSEFKESNKLKKIIKSSKRGDFIEGVRLNKVKGKLRKREKFIFVETNPEDYREEESDSEDEKFDEIDINIDNKIENSMKNLRKEAAMYPPECWEETIEYIRRMYSEMNSLNKENIEYYDTEKEEEKIEIPDIEIPVNKRRFILDDEESGDEYYDEY